MVHKKVLDAPTIRAGGKAIGQAIKIPDGVKTILLTCKLTYHGSATDGAEVKIYTNPTGKSWDTDPYASFLMPFTAGATKQKTVLVDVEGLEFIRADIENLDSSYPITNAKIIVVSEKDVFSQ
ncbi:hypothetical protein DRO24_00295 [Candidatus Bathyarchaeota archaeon]|nr:MAG: hypothetical protein DRO24_00295 [Candidatus Bathyarchaeota archaeon]